MSNARNVCVMEPRGVEKGKQQWITYPKPVCSERPTYSSPSLVREESLTSQKEIQQVFNRAA